MKKAFRSLGIVMAAVSLLAGCAWQVGGGTTVKPTVGQELIDLQKAKQAGVITDAEYQAQKQKLLNSH